MIGITNKPANRTYDLVINLRSLAFDWLFRSPGSKTKAHSWHSLASVKQWRWQLGHLVMVIWFCFLVLNCLIHLKRILLVRSWTKEIFRLHGAYLARTRRFIGLLFQVVWEIPEELRRELSRLGSQSTLRWLRAQVKYERIRRLGLD